MIDRVKTLTDGPALTILIPSYNRGPRVRGLVGYLIQVVDEFDGAIELIVANNRSTDDTNILFDDIVSPWFRLHTHDVHYPTAEENIFNSLALCRGKYVWFHGDDDLTNLGTVRFTMAMLSRDDYDCLSFASQYIDKDGGACGGWFIRMNAETLTVDFAKGACAIGLNSGMAGISNTILRRAPLEMVDWREILQRAPIYSHVAWWLIAFRGLSITFVNKPLVSYRVDDPVTQGRHFTKLAKLIKVPDFHFWTSGLIDLLSFLENRGAISQANVQSIYESRTDGSQFRLLDNIVEMIQRQASVGLLSKDPRNQVKSEDIDRMIQWVLHIDPGYFELTDISRKTFALQTSTEFGRYKTRSQLNYLNSRFSDLMNNVRNNAVLRNDFRGRYFNYLIFEHLTSFVGFDENASLNVGHLLRGLDVAPNGYTIFCATGVEELKRQLDTRIAHHNERMSHNQMEPIRAEMARIGDALFAGAHAVFDAGRFPNVSLARSIVWRVQRFLRHLGTGATRLKSRFQRFGP